MHRYLVLKKRFKKAHSSFAASVPNPESIDEHSPIAERIEFVKAFEELNNAYEALVTYDEYNDDMEKSQALQDQVKVLEEYVGIYTTVKGSLTDESEPGNPGDDTDFSGIEI